MSRQFRGEINFLVVLKTIVFVCILFLLILINFLIGIPVFILLSLFIRNQNNLFLRFSRWFIRMGFRMLFVLDLKEFRKQIQSITPAKGPRIYILNHASMFDIILLFLLPDLVRILVKESYTRIPLLGPIIRKTGQIVVKEYREGQDESGNFQEALSALESGSVLAVFPEGTRSKNGVIGRFKSGAFRLAYETRAELVPVVMDTWNIVRPGNGLWFRDSLLYSSILPSIRYEEYSSLDPLDLSKMIRNRMVKELEAIRYKRRQSEKHYYRKEEPYLSLDRDAVRKAGLDGTEEGKTV